MRRQALDYSPGLDGLRALCLLAVLAFHSGFRWAGGGFLGVSTFFTLSGYLITTILLSEQNQFGSVSIQRFWSHRLRRLAPASMMTLAAILATAPAWMELSARERLPSDVLTSLAYATNFRLIFGGYDYAQIFTQPSPVQHFWSLAIEAQFYLVFPLLIVLLVRAGKMGTSVGLFVLTAICAATPLAYEDATRIYYGTDTRASELMFGALLALVPRPGLPAGKMATACIHAVGVAALASLVTAWSWARVDSAWLYQGGFTLYAMGSAVVVFATLNGGVIASLLAHPVLVSLGRVSYGGYLYHWPIFLAVTPESTGLSAVPLCILRFGLAIGVAALSYHFVELPIRRGTFPRKPVFAVFVTLSSVLLGIGALAASPAGFLLQTRSYLETARFAFFDPARNVTGVRITVFGDSTATRLARGTAQWARQNERVDFVPGRTLLGCGLLGGRILLRDRWSPPPDVCARTLEGWGESVAASLPDVAVVLVGTWEVRTRILDGDAIGQPRIPGDPLLDGAIYRAINDAVDVLRRHGALVVWLTAPTFSAIPLDGEVAKSDLEASEPWRIEHFNQIVRSVAAERPQDMRVVDLAGHIADSAKLGTYENLRPDGVHLSLASATQLAHGWLGDQILRAYVGWKRE